MFLLQTMLIFIFSVPCVNTERQIIAHVNNFWQKARKLHFLLVNLSSLSPPPKARNSIHLWNSKSCPQNFHVLFAEVFSHLRVAAIFQHASGKEREGGLPALAYILRQKKHQRAKQNLPTSTLKRIHCHGFLHAGTCHHFSCWEFAFPSQLQQKKNGGKKKFTLEHLQIHKSIPPGHRGVTARCHQHPLHFPLTVSKPHSTAVTHKHPDRLKNNFPGLRSPAAKRLSAVTSLLALLLQQIQIYTSIYFPSKIQAGSLIRKEDWH